MSHQKAQYFASLKQTLLAVCGCFLLLLPLFDMTAAAAELGKTVHYSITKITDGDSLRAGDIRIRLHGIDAPEMRQSCLRADDTPYQCGRQAQAYLARWLGTDASVRCVHLDTDRYNRLVMRCYYKGIDINAGMVRAGWALAYRRYSEDYVADERQAQAAKAGMWQGRFETPEAWRRAN